MTSNQTTPAVVTPTFEIKVAIVGNVSAGKSTLLNALLGDKFSQVALKRTTANVNYFRIHQSDQECDESLQNADSVLQCITSDNTNGNSGHQTLNEWTFDVAIDHSICEMRKDTQLVLIDIPGINVSDETESNMKSRNFLVNKWDTFDCVIVVIDAFQIGTVEERDLLEFIDTNNRTLSDIPTIVVANKVDNPDDEECIQQVEEIRKRCTEIFGLKSAIQKEQTNNETKSKMKCLPLSAKNSFIYRRAGTVGIHKLSEPKYSDLVNKIGCNEFGLVWSTMNEKEKIGAVVALLRDPSELDARLKVTNFTCLLSTISEFVGGNDRQQNIILRQIEQQLKYGGHDEMICDSFVKSIRQLKAIGKLDQVGILQNAFWFCYRNCEHVAFMALEESLNPKSMVRPYQELEKYCKVSLRMGWNEQAQLAFIAIKQLLLRQLTFVLEKLQGWSLEAYCLACGATKEGVIGNIDYRNGNPIRDVNSYRLGGLKIYWPEWIVPQKIGWNNMPPRQWIYILESLSLVWNQGRFVKHFGPEKIKLERALMNCRCTFVFFSSGSLALEDGLWLFAYKDQSTLHPLMNSTLPIPQSLTNASHWGFLAWKFINRLGREKRKASSLVFE